MSAVARLRGSHGRSLSQAVCAAAIAAVVAACGPASGTPALATSRPIGTGGAGLYPVLGRRAGSEAVVVGRHGIIRLEFAADGYAWQFISTPAGTVLDAGSDTCG